MVTELSTLLVVSSGLRNVLKFMKYNDLHVKVVRPLCECRSNSLMANVWPCVVAVD